MIKECNINVAINKCKVHIAKHCWFPVLLDQSVCEMRKSVGQLSNKTAKTYTCSWRVQSAFFKPSLDLIKCVRRMVFWTNERTITLFTVLSPHVYAQHSDLHNASVFSLCVLNLITCLYGILIMFWWWRWWWLWWGWWAVLLYGF